MKKEAVALTLAALLNAACGGAVAVDEDTVWYGSPEAAENPGLKIHEKIHQDQMRGLEGGAAEFWQTYLSNPDQACAWEIEANIAQGVKNPEDHPACKGFFGKK